MTDRVGRKSPTNVDTRRAAQAAAPNVRQARVEAPAAERASWQPPEAAAGEPARAAGESALRGLNDKLAVFMFARPEAKEQQFDGLKQQWRQLSDEDKQASRTHWNGSGATETLFPAFEQNKTYQEFARALPPPTTGAASTMGYVPSTPGPAAPPPPAGPPVAGSNPIAAPPAAPPATFGEVDPGALARLQSFTGNKFATLTEAQTLARENAGYYSTPTQVPDRGQDQDDRPKGIKEFHFNVFRFNDQGNMTPELSAKGVTELLMALRPNATEAQKALIREQSAEIAKKIHEGLSMQGHASGGAPLDLSPAARMGHPAVDTHAIDGQGNVKHPDVETVIAELAKGKPYVTEADLKEMRESRARQSLAQGANPAVVEGSKAGSFNEFDLLAKAVGFKQEGVEGLVISTDAIRMMYDGSLFPKLMAMAEERVDDQAAVHAGGEVVTERMKNDLRDQLAGHTYKGNVEVELASNPIAPGPVQGTLPGLEVKFKVGTGPDEGKLLYQPQRGAGQGALTDVQPKGAAERLPRAAVDGFLKSFAAAEHAKYGDSFPWRHIDIKNATRTPTNSLVFDGLIHIPDKDGNITDYTFSQMSLDQGRLRIHIVAPKEIGVTDDYDLKQMQ